VGGQSLGTLSFSFLDLSTFSFLVDRKGKLERCPLPTAHDTSVAPLESTPWWALKAHGSLQGRAQGADSRCNPVGTYRFEAIPSVSQEVNLNLGRLLQEALCAQGFTSKRDEMGSHRKGVRSRLT